MAALVNRDNIHLASSCFFAAAGAAAISASLETKMVAIAAILLLKDPRNERYSRSISYGMTIGSIRAGIIGSAKAPGLANAIQAAAGTWINTATAAAGFITIAFAGTVINTVFDSRFRNMADVAQSLQLASIAAFENMVIAVANTMLDTPFGYSFGAGFHNLGIESIAAIVGTGALLATMAMKLKSMIDPSFEKSSFISNTLPYGITALSGAAVGTIGRWFLS